MPVTIIPYWGKALRTMAILMLVCTAPLAHAEDPPKKARPTCAVLTFDARSGISKQEASLLTDRFSIELDKLKLFTLINRSKMAEILKIQEFSRTDSCSASECAVEAGRILGVRYMIYGSLGKIGSIFTMNTYLVNVENGATEKSATTDRRGKIEDLLTQSMRMNARKLMGLPPGKDEPLPPMSSGTEETAMEFTPTQKNNSGTSGGPDDAGRTVRRPRVH